MAKVVSFQVAPMCYAPAMGKYILFLYLWKGAAPVTEEFHNHIMQEFGDKAACEAVAEKFNKAKGGGWRAEAGCFPYSSEPTPAP